jgi:protein-L-isoaspartate O-methyltransferase
VPAAGRDVLELGSASGVGTAALAETARSVVTVEVDAGRAAVVPDLPNVRALVGDWRESSTGRSASCSPTRGRPTGSGFSH